MRRSIILLAAALCCQATPQAVVPLVYTSASNPAGVIPAFSSLLNVVQGPKPVVLSNTPSFFSQPSPVLLRSTLPAVSLPVPVPAVPALPLGLSATQYRSQDELGNVAFNHAGGPNSRSEIRTAFGAQVGSFTYIDGEGKVQHRSYVSDALGTRMAGTDLPVAPKETPEVAKARAALTEMQASRGGRSRRSTSTLPLLRFSTTPITHSVRASTFSLPLATYTTFPAVAQVAAPGISSTVVAPAAAPAAPVSPATLATDGTKTALRTIDTLTPKPAKADAAASSDVLVKAAALPAQPVVVASVSSPSVALATKPGPSTVVVKSPAQPVAVAASSVQTPVLVQTPQPGPSTVLVKSAPAQPVATVAVAAQPEAPAVLVKAAPAAAVAVSSPAVAVSAPMPAPMEAPSPPAPSPEVPFKGGKFHSQDELGQYTFGHFGGSHTRVETKDFLGHTRGSFAYLNPEGEVHVRKYAAASGLGFTVAGSDLPVDNNAPVEETPEVAQARRAHLALKESEKKAKAV